MRKLREFSFPVVVLGAWVLVSAYTLSSLGEAHASVQAAQMPTLQAPMVEIVAPAPAKEASLTPKAQKKLSRRGPRV
jgi:hypothetical protein